MSLMKEEQLATLDWEKVDNLMPVIVQNQVSGKVLMLGYVNEESLAATLESGKMTFFSRTKQRLWCKGEQSGNFLNVVEISSDCDNDTLLAIVNPIGPTCHLGNETCFKNEQEPSLSFISDLEQVIKSRKGADPKSSYTASLYARGTKRISQKVGEEGVEVALAAMAKDMDELTCESADLLYHLTVLLQNEGLSLSDVADKLAERHSK
ncbi:bifunctional phosphoribosyl-AMP cyclohydrolase/phosphoribosyl-ATP diphosphatase HisIE [Psychromonas sp. 14N.309.X.WAT.B.A12]|uniref:bifunctional phosphoribosyl-AMP cyclohydrolase/phosphoribosyl-ATP diphosphatase HisIE n=1 Tax=unclassified Psychromonas TaxID=2614957 RepID=UPI0025B182AE|nr:bifunctional phosphoribosyl-AMP cyclohydrolase/phosphoribosyl-ATP diphosphatase HisIE [Psychromonas sp. 14N.309.X.WAT.B.A12]MDN2662231.1 bifunctional phosphoribosyl-AMP cyclohydrolase/phosphoribosyl-ATP diphosphatase HisIE [Psychromonas sp. 14N.309.X.WAT.B.A12]